MKRVLVICFALLMACVPQLVLAHEVRPAYLEITQTNAAQYDIVWKQPTQGELAIHLVPHLSNGWLEQVPQDQYASQGFLIRSWRVTAQLGESLNRVAIDIEGLQNTITDAFINIRLLDGERINAIVRPEQPRFVIEHKAQQVAVSAYLWLGVEHILTGPDHLLFVLGLLLIVRERGTLLKTVTAFTLAHSITLTATMLGKISLPVAFVEMLIALSILFLGPEIVRAHRGGSSLTIRYPWLVAFAFGLFHGMGFASGLTALGFSSEDLPITLLLFNLGVEIGQVVFIVLALLFAAALRRMQVHRLRYVGMTPAYLVGVAGAYWATQCGAQWLGVF